MQKKNFSYMRATAMHGFTAFVDNQGGDGAQILRDCGLSENIEKESDLLLPFELLCKALDLAALRTDRPNFGLDWISSFPDHFPNLGPISLIASFVENLEQWIFAGLQYGRYHTNSFTFTLLPDEDPGRVLFRYVGLAPGIPPRQIAEHTIGNMVRMAQRVIGADDARPSIVRFQHAKPASTTAHEDFFQCPVEFYSPHTEVIFERKFLSYPTSGNKGLLKPIVDFFIRYRISQMPIYEQTLRTTVELAIPSIMGTGHCSIDFIAASLGMSRKKMQRELAKEGTSFQEILNQVKEKTALRLLAETSMPIQRIAGLLDYSAPAAFVMSFRRWTNMSPLEYRKLRHNPALTLPL